MKGNDEVEQHSTNSFEPRIFVAQLKERLTEMNYSKATIDRLDSVWRNFTQYWEEHHQLEFSLQTIQEFTSTRYGCKMGDRDSAHNVLRAMNMLWDFVHYQQVFKQSSLNIRRFNSEFENAFEGFLTFLKDSGYSDGSRRTFRSILFQFEEYLQNRRICKICEITEACLQNYVKTMSRFAPRTTAWKLRLIKQWLEYCYTQGYLDRPLSFTIPRIHVPKNIELPTVFTREEVQKLLASVDRSNPLGRRDYAILIMAAKLGLRVSDIINLTFDEIDWAKKTLSITQQKTGKLVELPLTEDVGWAIIDYLQNGRPESECIHVFIKHCAPYDGLNSNISKRLQKYLSKAEIKYPAGKTVGMHTFRRSLASAMLENGVPIAVISGTLGHTGPHSTETYLRIAIPQLRACALEVMD